jgi:hypothetical protein
MADYLTILWDDEESGNVEHIAWQGLTPDEVEDVIRNPGSEVTSGSSGRRAALGYTATGRYIFVVYEEIDAFTILPITAYEIDEQVRP